MSRNCDKKIVKWNLESEKKRKKKNSARRNICRNDKADHLQTNILSDIIHIQRLKGKHKQKK
jgi:hypothetical protein